MPSSNDDPRIGEFLETTFGSEKFSPKISFAELKKIFCQFNDQFKKRGIKIVSIAGTNGKGETAHSLHFLCKEHGISSLMWTSPHILTVRERFQTHAGAITAADLWEEINQANMSLGNQLRLLSYYEFLFYVFCQWALKSAPDTLILEVGIGGRLDAINVLDPVLCLLTSIGRDHVEFLGPSYNAILGEKLGITRPFVPLLSTLRLNYCREKVQEFTHQNQIPWIDFFNCYDAFSSWPYFERNQFLAFASLKTIAGIRTMADAPQNLLLQFNNFRQRLAFPIFQARREQMTLGDKRFIFVGAHNIEGMRELANYVDRSKEAKVEEKGRSLHIDQNAFVEAKCLLVSFSKRSGHEIHLMLRQLLGIRSIDKIIVCSFQHGKAFVRHELEAIVTEYKGTTIEWCENWQIWLETETTNDPVLVVGSYYFIADVQDFILHSS